MRRDTPLISSALDPEDTWTEAENSWVFVVESGGLRGRSLIFTKVSLMTFPDNTLKASHDSSKI